MHNQIDLAGIALKHGRYVFLHDALIVQLAHQSNVVLSKARHPYALASDLSPFVAHVSHVVLVSTKKQAQRIRAWSIVTPVQYVKAVRNRAIMDSPRKAVDKQMVTGDIVPNEAVSLAVKAASPPPTIGRLFAFDNIPPEKVGNGDAHGCVSTFAVAKRLASDLGGLAMKCLPACLTDTVEGIRLGAHPNLHSGDVPPAVTSSAGATLLQWSLIVPQMGA